MAPWLARANEEQLAAAATLATVMYTRVIELGQARVQSKAVIDALEQVDLEAARNVLARSLAVVAELRRVVDSLEELARQGP